MALDRGRVDVIQPIFTMTIVFGDPAGGRNNAPNWEWFAAIAVIAVVCGILLPLAGGGNLSLKAGAYGTVAGVLSGLAATLTKPTVELLHSGGLGGAAGAADLAQGRRVRRARGRTRRRRRHLAL
jgi:uncharacterized membrane protein HdeD (DUF308 family)